MIAPRWKKVLRDLWNSKTRTLLVVLSIAVGVFAVGAVTQTFTIVGEELTVTYPKANPASATLYPGSFDQDLVEMVRRMPGVADAEGRSFIGGQIKLGENNQRLFYVFAIADPNDIRIGKIKPQGAYDPAPDFHSERGHWPPGDREIVLERSSLLVPGHVPAGLQVGDKIDVEFNSRKRELTVAGLAYHPSFVPAPFANAAYGFVNMETYEWLVGTNQFDMLLITVADERLNQEHIKQVAQAVQAKIESGGRTVYSTEVPVPGRHPLQDTFTGILLLLNLLAYGSLLLSGFLVVNIINAILAQQIRQIGMMKSIGAQTGQMIAMYLGMVLLFGVLALLIAIPLATLVANQTTAYLAGFMNVDFQEARLSPDLLLLEIMIGIGLPLIAALFPIIGGTRITVRQAISDYGLGKSDSAGGWIDRLVDRVRGLSRPMLISFRNTFRRKSRLALTLITLILAGTIFISVNSVHSSMLLTLDDAWKSWNWDVLINFDRAYRADLVEPLAQSVPGVTAVEAWGGTSARRVRPDDSESEALTLFAPPPKTQMMVPTITEGRWLLPDDENALVMSLDVLKQEKDIKIGDEIELKIGGRKSTWKVVGKIAHRRLVRRHRTRVRQLSILCASHRANGTRGQFTNRHTRTHRRVSGKSQRATHDDIQRCRRARQQQQLHQPLFPVEQRIVFQHHHRIVDGHGGVDGNRRRAGTDGHDVDQRVGTHARNRRDARDRRIERRDSRHRDDRRRVHRHAERIDFDFLGVSVVARIVWHCRRCGFSNAAEFFIFDERRYTVAHHRNGAFGAGEFSAGVQRLALDRARSVSVSINNIRILSGVTRYRTCETASTGERTQSKDAFFDSASLRSESFE